MDDDRALPLALGETLDTALGRGHRDDPLLPGTGGPAGNARLTAWTGLVLLMLFSGELVTLLDVRGLIDWHLSLGVALVPPALLKTATTGWRVVGYYAGRPVYRTAGPPPVLLRWLGPLVVLTTLALLATGVVVVLVGEEASRTPLLTVVGQRVGVVTLHQAAFAAWAVATGLHVLARLVPAWLLVRPRGVSVAGSARRAVALVVAGALAVVAVGWVLGHSGGWRDGGERRPVGQHRDG